MQGTMVETLLINLGVVLALQFAAWLISIARRDASTADLFWGGCFAVLVFSSYSQTEVLSVGSRLLIGMTLLWGARLTLYLIYRNWGLPEDPRYRAMREKHGERFAVVSLATVFGLQGTIAWIIALPLQVGIANPGGPAPLLWAGLAIWAVGLAIESAADTQLARFKADPANTGHVMDRGLWRYSRHPNYFGECLVWWGIYLAAARAESWWWTALGPTTITILLLKVSGVTLLERSLEARLDRYGEYVDRTSAFLPWPPKKSSIDQGGQLSRGA